MKKTLIFSTLAVAGMLAAPSANAALASDAVLQFDAASSGGIVEPATGSWFSMLALDLDVDGVGDTNVYTPIGSTGGITLGTFQASSGSHSGSPDGTENDLIDNAWSFFTNTGMHGTGSVNGGTAPSVVTDNGTGNVTINMSGWYVDWNTGNIDMGQGADAVMTCSGNCSVGDTYTLDYSAVVPSGTFTGVPYALHLEGTVNAVPVPAAVWLFGSGLLGLVGVARRRNKA